MRDGEREREKFVVVDSSFWLIAEKIIYGVENLIIGAADVRTYTDAGNDDLSQATV